MEDIKPGLPAEDPMATAQPNPPASGDGSGDPASGNGDAQDDVAVED